jgi:hypothetical protein
MPTRGQFTSGTLAAANPKAVQELESRVQANRVDPPEQVEPARAPGQRRR